MIRTRVLVSLTLGACLPLAACGSKGSDNKAEQDEIAKVRAAIQKTVDKGAMPFAMDAAAVTCVATTAVQKLGVAKTEQYQLGATDPGQSKPTLSAEDAKVVAGALVDCAPHNGVLTYYVGKLNEGLGSTVTATQKACVDRGLTRDLLVDALAAGYSDRAAAGETAFSTAMKAQAKACGLK